VQNVSGTALEDGRARDPLPDYPCKPATNFFSSSLKLEAYDCPVPDSDPAKLVATLVLALHGDL